MRTFSFLKNRYIRLTINLLIAIGVWFFIIRTLLKNVEFDFSLNIINPVYFFLSFFFMFLTGVVHPWFIVITIKRISFFKSFRIWWLSTMGRYIPGKLWMFAGFVYLLKKENLDHIQYSSVMVFVQIAVILSSLFLAILLYGSKYIPFYYSLPLIILLLILYSMPSIYLPFLKKILKREIYSPGIYDLILIFFLSMVVWFVYGASLVFLVKSFGGRINLIEGAGMFSLSYISGLLAIFTPGGLGVREGVMSIMLKQTMPSLSLKIPVYMRAINIIVEVIFFIISYTGFLIVRNNKRE